MSDYFGKDSNPSGSHSAGSNPWQQDPFAPYDDPSMTPPADDAASAEPFADAPYVPSEPRTPDYSAWRRPASAGPARPVRPAQPDGAADPGGDAVNPYSARPDFSAPPAAFGGNRPRFGAMPPDASAQADDPYAPDTSAYGMRDAEDVDVGMQRIAGGFMPPVSDGGNFAALGADAPTRITRPALGQTVNKHVSVGRDQNNPLQMPQMPQMPQPPQPAEPPRDAGRPAQADAAPADAEPAESSRRRRTGRVARHEENAIPPQPIAGLTREDGFTPPINAATFDPFEAGDSETPAQPEEPALPATEAPRVNRRPADPGARYTGARTAMPRAGMQPQRDQADEPRASDALPLENNPRPGVPMPGARATGPNDRQWDGRGRPAPVEGRRPMGAEPGDMQPQTPMEGRRPVRVDANGRPIPPQGQRPVPLDANGRPIPLQGQRPVRLDANGRPIPPQGQRPVQLDADGRPIPPQGQRPVRLDANGRPIPPQGQRPVQLDPDGRPIPPQGQRPVPLDANGRPIPAQGQRPVPLDANGRPMASQPGMDRARAADPYAAQTADDYDPRRRQRMEPEAEGSVRFDPRRNYPVEMKPASVDRPRYGFENGDEEEELPRRGGVLIPLVVVLLVIGGLLAGILLPDWAGMGGGLGTAMSKIKLAVTDVFDSVKGMISPDEAGIKSLSVSPTSATAPVELVFNVQASTSVSDIRILDQNGVQLVEKTLSDSDMLDGEVTKNSNDNIWTMRYTYEGAYDGVFTAQNMKKDGTWGEGYTLETPVSIAAPAVVEPPVQDFTTDSEQGITPALVGFSVVTSMDVTALQIVNDYGDVITEAYLNDADVQVKEQDDTRIWTLDAQVNDPYTGSFFVGYETESELDFVQSDYSVDVTLTTEANATSPDANSGDADAADEGDAANTDSAPMQSSLDGNDTAVTDGENLTMIGVDGADGTDGDVSADGADATDGANGDISADGANATDAATDAAALSASATTSEPAAEAATPAPASTPEPTAVPILEASADTAADPTALKLTTKVYQGTKALDTFERESDAKIVISEPIKYAQWDQSGVLTFRGGPFRQNAAFGTAEIETNTFTEMWKVEVDGGIKAKAGTLTGVGWPGQPIIVKWPTQLRTLLNINAEFKEKKALKEVMVGAQNGKIYFIDLISGGLTRTPIENEWPSNGVMSLQTNASPMLAVGQHNGVLAKKTIDNGLHLINLIDDKELTLLSGKDKQMQSNYSGFNGAPLFDMNTGDMIVGGENGLLYTVEVNDDFDHIIGTLKISPTIQKYSWLANKQKKKSTNIDGAVAMYGSYVYFGDQTGIVQCVNVNTLAPVWAVDTGDNVDATIALDMESETAVSLYTGNTLVNQGRSGVCTIRKLDALTGKQLWAFTVPDLVYTTEYNIGCYASPIVGINSVSDLVFFTVTNGSNGATLYALDKATGSVRWSTPLETETVSSPVAVYNLKGDAWILQAESNGRVNLIDASNGTKLSSTQLEGQIESSPAVYGNVLVIATTGSDTSYIYGIKLE